MYIDKQIDIDIRNAFNASMAFNSLKKIEVEGSCIRGLFPSTIEFNYPITAIAGSNGSGKSTLLALISCAFHNSGTFTPLSKVRQKTNYYTYSDFFFFAAEERGPIAELKIKNNYLTSVVPRYPKIQGLDIRKKKPSGKWNDYNTRPERVVSYLGINRILPPSESSLFRSYKRSFAEKVLPEDIKNLLLVSLRTIFRRNYSDLKLKEYKNCRLFIVNNVILYTGYNMGAGEHAVLNLLYEIITAGNGALIVVDEIELGIHISAQKGLVRVLKELCKKYHCQIVCSTHSQYILGELPSDGRILIQSSSNNTTIFQDITPEFALTNMSGINVPELTILVEDNRGEDFLKGIIDSSLRRRVRICQIGSADGPIPRHMAAYYREGNHRYCSFMDGDKRGKRNNHQRIMKNELGDRLIMTDDEFTEYLDNRMFYLPGTTWPEKHLMEETLKQTDFASLANWGISDDEIRHYCNMALAAGKHSEIFTLSRGLGIDEKIVYSDVVRLYKVTHSTEIDTINNAIRNLMGP